MSSHVGSRPLGIPFSKGEIKSHTPPLPFTTAFWSETFHLAVIISTPPPGERHVEAVVIPVVSLQVFIILCLWANRLQTGRKAPLVNQRSAVVSWEKIKNRCRFWWTGTYGHVIYNRYVLFIETYWFLCLYDDLSFENNRSRVVIYHSVKIFNK